MADNSDNIIQRVENRTKDFVKQQVENSVLEGLPKTSSSIPKMSSSPLIDAVKPVLAEIVKQAKQPNDAALIAGDSGLVMQEKLLEDIPAIKAALALMKKEGAHQGEHVEKNAAPSSVCSADTLVPIPAKGR